MFTPITTNVYITLYKKSPHDFGHFLIIWRSCLAEVFCKLKLLLICYKKKDNEDDCTCSKVWIRSKSLSSFREVFSPNYEKPSIGHSRSCTISHVSELKMNNNYCKGDKLLKKINFWFYFLKSNESF